MSRRANGTNRAAELCGGSKYTGYAKPKKKAASLTELNDHLTKKLQFSRCVGEMQDGREKND